MIAWTFTLYSSEMRMRGGLLYYIYRISTGYSDCTSYPLPSHHKIHFELSNSIEKQFFFNHFSFCNLLYVNICPSINDTTSIFVPCAVTIYYLFLKCIQIGAICCIHAANYYCFTLRACSFQYLHACVNGFMFLYCPNRSKNDILICHHIYKALS